MRQHKVSNYLLYALGEILLVVIGILIALQINNWNQRRLDHQESTEYHQRLASDLDMIAVFLDDVISFTELVETGIHDAVKILESGVMTDSTRKVVDKALGDFFRLSRHLPALTSYDEMKSTGQLGLIYNQELREEIADYMVLTRLAHTVFEDLNEKVNQTAFIDPYVKFDRRSNIAGPVLEYDFVALAADRKVINTLSRYAYHWSTKARFSKRLLRATQDLKTAVDTELSLLQ